MAVFQYSDNLPVFTAAARKLIAGKSLLFLRAFLARSSLKHIHENTNLIFGIVAEDCTKWIAIIANVEFWNGNRRENCECGILKSIARIANMEFINGNRREAKPDYRLHHSRLVLILNIWRIPRGCCSWWFETDLWELSWGRSGDWLLMLLHTEGGNRKIGRLVKFICQAAGKYDHQPASLAIYGQSWHSCWQELNKKRDL